MRRRPEAPCGFFRYLNQCSREVSFRFGADLIRTFARTVHNSWHFRHRNQPSCIADYQESFASWNDARSRDSWMDREEESRRVGAGSWTRRFFGHRRDGWGLEGDAGTARRDRGGSLDDRFGMGTGHRWNDEASLTEGRARRRAAKGARDVATGLEKATAGFGVTHGLHRQSPPAHPHTGMKVTVRQPAPLPGAGDQDGENGPMDRGSNSTWSSVSLTPLREPSLHHGITGTKSGNRGLPAPSASGSFGDPARIGRGLCGGAEGPHQEGDQRRGRPACSEFQRACISEGPSRSTAWEIIHW